jgi:hypothetical protein
VTRAFTPPAAPGDVRRYRFGPLDQAGWLLGLDATQCVTLGAAILLGGIGLRATGSIVVAGVAVLVGGLVAFGRWDGRRAYEWAGPGVGWVMMRRRGHDHWTQPVTSIVATDPDKRRASAGGGGGGVAPCLEGIELFEVPWPYARAACAHGLGVVTDRSRATFSATLRVRGREFALLERVDQEHVLDGWGNALGAFAREHTPVTRIVWSEWAAPASLDDHLGFLREHHTTIPAGDTHAGLGDYVTLVSSAGPLTTAHDALVTVTVDRRRLVRARGQSPELAAVESLAEELRLFAARLEQAQLVVDGPLSAAELAHVIRLRLDPTCAPRLSTRHQHAPESLGEAAGIVSAAAWSPMAVRVRWRHVEVDQSWHRSFWISGWPRQEVGPDWLTGVVLHPSGIRTLTVVYEPVAPSRSRRAIDRDATRLASDEEQRARRGFRIRAQHRRAEHEVFAREAELVAGYPELTYAGFFTITAPSQDDLDAQTRDWEQTCAQAGLELRALDGQHDLGITIGLPVTAPLSRRGAGR